MNLEIKSECPGLSAVPVGSGGPLVDGGEGGVEGGEEGGAGPVSVTSRVKGTVARDF